MSFNTAIFYDIENLLKGYNFSQEMAFGLSLAEIVRDVKATNRIGEIATQRAYANWSDRRLGFMRNEINELGIDPIQVFGFSWDQKKNAADIQLAIDAIDLAHVRPSIEVFVIVSGDGGFASLAKKLHEYGKTVIGCAYLNAANRTFRAVCDEFVKIDDPEEDEGQIRPASAQAQTIKASSGFPSTPLAVNATVNDPRNVRIVQKIKKILGHAPAQRETLAKVREILNAYLADPACKADLAGLGIYLSVLREAIKYAIPDFQPARFGFPKFIEYIQYACANGPLCVSRPPHTANTEAVVALRTAIAPGVEILPDIEDSALHSLDRYKSLLASGHPIIRVPPAGDMRAIIGWLADRPIQSSDLGGMIESAVGDLGGAVSAESTKLGLLSLISAEAFQREPENVSLSEQKLSLIADAHSVRALYALLRSAATKKLSGMLGQIDESMLLRLLGEAPGDPR